MVFSDYNPPLSITSASWKQAVEQVKLELLNGQRSFSNAELMITVEKHSYSGTPKISDRCIAMMNIQPKIGKFVFHKDDDDLIRSLVTEV
jgi:hypothetical protein